MGKRTELRQSKKRSRWIRRTALVTLLFFLSSITFGSAMIYAYVNGTPKLTKEALRDPQSSMIYDMNDKFVTYVTGKERREYAKINEIPELVQQAFISTEDTRFREHFGIDVKRIAGAALANVKDGFGAEGASTITQQVVKNSVLSSDKTIKRKIQEAYLAVKLEQKYSKDEILEMYLNKIYFGSGAYGVATASKTYFNKPLSELKPEEAALLAGLPQRPSGYDPFLHPKQAEERRNTVLNLMYKNGAITKAEKDKAIKTPVTDSLVKDQGSRLKYESFIQQVIKELKKKGIPEQAIYEGGLKIYTTLDQKAQAHTEKVLSTDEFVKYPSDKFKAGVALLDTKTGAIRAIGGNRTADKNDVIGGYNYATDIQRQPGSTIKPILDYGPAIDGLKWPTYKQINDEKLDIGDWEVNNWDDEFHGEISMREALVNSYNIPAIKTFMEVGSKDAVGFANKLGMNIENATPAYAIGGFSRGPSPLQLAGAYTAFGNKGIYHEPTTLRKVTFSDGYEKKYETKPVAAMHDYTAYMITDMLKDVVKRGTGTLAAIPGLEVAGKTGTTNMPEGANIDEKGSSDSWFAGYTTNYTAAVWTGYDKTTSEQYLTPEDQKIAKYIFKSIVSEVSKDKKTAGFEQPKSVEEIYVNKDTGYISKDKNSSNVTRELIIKGTSTKDLVKPVKERKAKPVKKDNKEEKKEVKKEEKDKNAEKDKKTDKEEKADDNKGSKDDKPPVVEPGNPDEPDNPNDPGTNPDDPGTNPDDPGTNPDDPGTNPDDPGTNPDDPGTTDPPPSGDTTGTTNGTTNGTTTGSGGTTGTNNKSGTTTTNNSDKTKPSGTTTTPTQ
ncbi:transglycosylase domain-containing protein [Fictibacillus barbaricus]|uniref:Penicillin-binding protein 1A n=1 Tax=Fictibacillus barbaricus TaxID=182136 RepID=A0ABU1U640_9BACL|nr:PBP1A family penicillin-binding protein [Fictibacillus barbaricus]MDR7074932.1 penicillin-binding protein 1A [Fictibacillus barbaricus]